MAPHGRFLPKAPSKLRRRFPIAVWLPKYNWGKYLTADLIAAMSNARSVFSVQTALSPGVIDAALEAGRIRLEG